MEFVDLLPRLSGGWGGKGGGGYGYEGSENLLLSGRLSLVSGHLARWLSQNNLQRVIRPRHTMLAKEPIIAPGEKSSLDKFCLGSF